jgi:hypothetical protein
MGTTGECKPNKAKTKADKVLAALLRTLGVTTLAALTAVFIPLSWMADTHRRLGLGEMPTAPVVEYLARSVSAFYAFFGVLCLMAAADLDRYLPLVRFLGISLAVMGIVFLGVDLVAGMPWWWSACEGLPVVVGTLLVFLARRNRRPDGTRGDPETAKKC